ncbi:unnamed protein product, partial [Effrenium voratum]
LQEDLEDELRKKLEAANELKDRLLKRLSTTVEVEDVLLALSCFSAWRRLVRGKAAAQELLQQAVAKLLSKLQHSRHSILLVNCVSSWCTLCARKAYGVEQQMYDAMRLRGCLRAWQLAAIAASAKKDKDALAKLADRERQVRMLKT